MRTLGIACLLATSAWMSPAGAAVTVTFVEPERYRDASLGGAYEAQSGEPALKEIGKHLQRLGERHLSADQTLRIEVLDVDLAGRFEPWRAGYHGVRFLDGVTWPVIRMRYTLERQGSVELSAEESVSDQIYLGRPSPYFTSDRVRYEKHMLDDWFRARFVEGRPPR